MKVIKRNGTLEDYQKRKLLNSIQKAVYLEGFTNYELTLPDKISNYLTNKYEEKGETLLSSQIKQDVIRELIKSGVYEISKVYEIGGFN